MKHSCHKDQLSSIRRIEGQVRGVEKMIEEGKYCIDILNQIKAVKNSITSVEGKILNTHLRECVKESLNSEENFEHAARQTYIAFMAAITQAAYEGLDSTPMEGFNAGSLDEILGLREKGLRSTLLLPIGYKNATKDWLVNLVKVRKPMKELVTFIK